MGRSRVSSKSCRHPDAPYLTTSGSN